MSRIGQQFYALVFCGVVSGIVNLHGAQGKEHACCDDVESDDGPIVYCGPICNPKHVACELDAKQAP